MKNIYDLPVHPAADVFPMLDPDELSDLAADIQANGLQHPIVVGVVDGVEMLIDGRNRLAACKLAGVDPEIKQLNGQDPESLILSENIMRRHMTKGQRGMAIAVVCPSGKLKINFSESYVKQARVVLKYSPEFTQAVLAGAKSLSEAYEEAKQRKNAGNDDTEKLDWLKVASQDLADKVVEGELTLAGAIAEHHERDRIAKINRDAALKSLRSGVYDFGSIFLSDDRLESTAALLNEYRSEFDAVCDRDTSDSLKYLKAIESKISVLINKLEK